MLQVGESSQRLPMAQRGVSQLSPDSILQLWHDVLPESATRIYHRSVIPAVLKYFLEVRSAQLVTYGVCPPYVILAYCSESPNLQHVYSPS